jgi:hypothetical protein
VMGVREHELPNGDLTVTQIRFAGRKKYKTTVVESDDRPLHRLHRDILADAHVPDLMPSHLANGCEDIVDVRETVMDYERGRADIEWLGGGCPTATKFVMQSKTTGTVSHLPS